MQNIRNFSIIAHIDHGKSTLADRLLEFTHTVESRKMKNQVLDSMDLERERGITIKMTPVRMKYLSKADGQNYILNLIDTPGHIDFAYEVSRSLRAVEGALLLIDATQGIQAQTLTTLEMAKNLNLKILPVINKIDSPLANILETTLEIIKLLKCAESEILSVSGKTGEGVENLLEEIIQRIPATKNNLIELENTNSHKNNVNHANNFAALIFDFEYSNHQGVILYVRILNGKIKRDDEIFFVQAKHRFLVREVGTFNPERVLNSELQAGEIGYVVTGIKEPGIAKVGDMIVKNNSTLQNVIGYEEPVPLVFASVYPESQEEFENLRAALLKLRLSDSSLKLEEEASGALGRGFRCGFLGMLHLEIVTERLSREFQQELIVTQPSITYEVTLKNGEVNKIYTPIYFPDHGLYFAVREPWIILTIITPQNYLSAIMQLLNNHEATVFDMFDWGEDRINLQINMPLRELMRNFFDEIKSVSSGYASLSYKLGEMKAAQVTRLDIYVNEERIAPFSRVVSEARAEEEANEAVDRLQEILPAELFRVKIQAYVKGKIIASRSIAAMKKDVTGHLYGGDITRKMKLREKQNRGKKRMQKDGKVHLEHETFLKFMKK